MWRWNTGIGLRILRKKVRNEDSRKRPGHIAEYDPWLFCWIFSADKKKVDCMEEEIWGFEQNGASGYWLPTRANGTCPLYQLLALAKLWPDGIWEGDWPPPSPGPALCQQAHRKTQKTDIRRNDNGER